MERGRRAVTRRYNLVNETRRSTSYEGRLYKYSKRGFIVLVPGYLPPYHYKVSEINILTRLLFVKVGQEPRESEYLSNEVLASYRSCEVAHLRVKGVAGRTVRR